MPKVSTYGRISPSLADLLYVVVDPDDTPLSKAATLTALLARLDASTSTFTGKTFDLTDNTLTGTLAELNAAISDDSIFPLSGGVTVTGDVEINGILSSGRHDNTISGGVITAASNYLYVDTQDGDPTDDLDTINGGIIGTIITLQSTNDGRTVVVKHGTGNIFLAGGVDFSLSNRRYTIMLVYAWRRASWSEVSRATVPN